MRCERCGASQQRCMPCGTRWKARLALVKAGYKLMMAGCGGCLIQLKPSIALKFLFEGQSGKTLTKSDPTASHRRGLTSRAPPVRPLGLITAGVSSSV